MIYDNLHTELIYFWLEKKSIFREPVELVFNKDYKCTFDVENTNVEVEYLNKIPKTNFFADNISFNVLAGANGTGKSTILKFMYEIIYNKESLTSKEEKFLIIFSNNQYITNIENLTFNAASKSNDLSWLFVSEFDSETSIQHKQHERNIDISTESLAKLLFRNFQYPDYIYADIDMFIFEPVYIEIKIFDSYQLFEKTKKEILKEIEYSNDSAKYINKFIEFLEFYDMHSENELILFWLNKIINNISELVDYTFKDGDTYLSIEDSLLELFNHEEEEYKKTLSEFNTLIEELKNNNGLISINNLPDDLKLKIRSNTKLYNFDFVDKYDRRYSHLSHGEKTIFAIFLHIGSIVDDPVNRKTCLFLLDEPELSLHPKWQRDLIFNLIKSFQNRNTFLQFIISTHSPLILSDLPHDKVIYFNKDNDKAFVEDSNTIKIKSFATDVDTLLSDSFFMGENLMGRFAKDKIEKILKSCNEVTNDNFDLKNVNLDQWKNKIYHFKEIKNMIGDEYLLNIINNHIEEIENILFGKKTEEEYIKEVMSQFTRDEIESYLGEIK